MEISKSLDEYLNEWKADILEEVAEMIEEAMNPTPGIYADKPRPGRSFDTVKEVVEVVEHYQPPSSERRLKTLERAYESGRLNEEEYLQSKEYILSRASE